MQETLEERELHLKNNRGRAKARRIQETPEEKQLCLKNNRERAKVKRMQETAEENEEHLKNRESVKVKMLQETAKEKELHLEKVKGKAKAKRSHETTQEKEVHPQKAKLNVDGAAECLIKNGSNADIRRAALQKGWSITAIGWTAAYMYSNLFLWSTRSNKVLNGKG